MPRRPAGSKLRRTLRDRFGQVQLRPGQKEEVIRSVLARREPLAIMPTGDQKLLERKFAEPADAAPARGERGGAGDEG